MLPRRDAGSATFAVSINTINDIMENQEQESVVNQAVAEPAVEPVASPADELSADTQEQQPKVYDEESVRTLVAEAEQRGYLRGRNEKIEMEMSRRGLFEQPDGREEAPKPSDPRNPCDMLSYIRPSVWD